MKKVIITCPPMIGQIDRLTTYAIDKGLEIEAADVVQTLSESQLVELIPGYDGWIIGDDPASYKVFEAAASGRLKAAVKWGIGVDNVDFDACDRLSIPIMNTPNMFGSEVADVATAYIVGLARRLFIIDRQIRQECSWPKVAGISLEGKNAGVVGMGDIGQQLCRRLTVFGMNLYGFDPFVPEHVVPPGVQITNWPVKLDELDFLVFTCSLNAKNYHMLDHSILEKIKPGCFLVNVARGGLIDEEALIAGLDTGIFSGAALDVFELEPLPISSRLREFPNCILGSHNSSNTEEAVVRASKMAIDKMVEFLYG